MQAAEPAPPPPVAAASASDLSSSIDQTLEFDKAQAQADAANKRLGELLGRLQRRDGKLPGSFGADLTDEQRSLLAERIQQERSGIRNLLQEILDKDKEVRDLRARAADLSARLPAHVVAADGDRHDKIVSDFLIKQGVPSDRALELLSQINLQQPLMPGFRVWTYYQNGQFGTWVTQGTAAFSPQDAQRRVLSALESQVDTAKRTVADAKAKQDAASAETGELLKRLEQEVAENEKNRKALAAERELGAVIEKDRAAIRYSIGSKDQLVRRKAITGNLRQVLSFDVVETQILDIGESPEIRIDGGTFGLKRIKKITLLPQVFAVGSDLQATIDGAFAVIRLLKPDKFAKNQFIIVLE